MNSPKYNIQLLKSIIRDVPDFPKPGILFKDITPLLHHVEARGLVVDMICAEFSNKNIEALAAIEARGFLFGMMLAERLKIPFIPIRKAGKLPYSKRTATYNLEYGTAVIEMHDDAFAPGTRVLVHDDVLATGGTAVAAGTLVQQIGGTVAGFSFLIDLTFLSGSKNLYRQFGVSSHSLLSY